MMKNQRSDKRRAGFTLVELLISIGIIIVLASIIFVMSKRAIESTRMAANVSNLRNLSTLIYGIAQERGNYPPGWSWVHQESWATLVVKDLHGDDALQDASLLSPVVARDIPPNLKHPTISNYSVSPFIFPQENTGGRGWTVSPSRLQRPHEQILLGDGMPRSSNAAYGFTMIVWWDLVNSGRAGNSGSPPVSNEIRSNRSISWPEGITEMEDDAGKGLPSFRNRGRGHFLFADGHVEALAPNELKYKHFAISY